ncbi:hypothetical protein GCM10022600_02910 [Qipengyuania pelagi]
MVDGSAIEMIELHRPLFVCEHRAWTCPVRRVPLDIPVFIDKANSEYTDLAIFRMLEKRDSVLETVRKQGGIGIEKQHIRGTRVRSTNVACAAETKVVAVFDRLEGEPFDRDIG